MSYQNPYDDRDIEDQVLDYVERVIGMSPPFYDKIQDNNGEKVVIPCREWELEDE